jgi:SMI1 / KNR4 family (SUKH-1)
MNGGRGDVGLARIRALLDTSRGEGWAYVPRPRLAEPNRLGWEAQHGVTLPEEYRQFLQEIGDGGQMPGSYCNFEITPLAGVRGARGAATPFPVTAERLRQRLRQLEAEGWPDEGVLFPELRACWEEADLPPGCVQFGQYPSADALLLVTAGDLRGSVWCGVCYGTAEMAPSGEPLGFLTWFADVLTDLEGGA